MHTDVLIQQLTALNAPTPLCLAPHKPHKHRDVSLPKKLQHQERCHQQRLGLETSPLPPGTPHSLSEPRCSHHVRSPTGPAGLVATSADSMPRGRVVLLLN